MEKSRKNLLRKNKQNCKVGITCKTCESLAHGNTYENRELKHSTM